MTSHITQTVRDLRKRQTPAEAKLWQALRNRKLCGKKFLRQQPIIFELDGNRRFFVADFYCHEAKLVIEVDGGIHETQKEYDKLRTHIINTLGIRVIRFKNEEVIHSLKDTLAKIKACL